MNNHQQNRFVDSHVNVTANMEIDQACPSDYKMKKGEAKSCFS